MSDGERPNSMNQPEGVSVSASLDRDHTGRASDKGSKFFAAVRWISLLAIAVSLLTIVRSLPLDQAMSAIKGWIAGLGYWGPVVLGILYIVATVLFVPGTILTLVAGAMFGLTIGMVTVSIGSTIGASLAFLIARYAAREKVAAMASGNRHFDAIDRAIGEGGWKIVGLLRLSPAIPFNLQNYLYGLTPVRFWPYAFTSWIAMMPGTFLYVYLGHVTGAAVAADRQRTLGEWAMLAIGLVATVVVTVYVTRLANRKLKEQADREQADEDADNTLLQSIDSSTKNNSGTNVHRTLMLAAIAAALVAAAIVVRFNADLIDNAFGGSSDRRVETDRGSIP